MHLLLVCASVLLLLPHAAAGQAAAPVPMHVGGTLPGTPASYAELQAGSPLASPPVRPVTPHSAHALRNRLAWQGPASPRQVLLVALPSARPPGHSFAVLYAPPGGSELPDWLGDLAVLIETGAEVEALISRATSVDDEHFSLRMNPLKMHWSFRVKLSTFRPAGALSGQM